MFSNITTALGTLAPQMLAIVAKSSLLLILSLAASLLLRRRSASLRHFLHSLAIVSVLILPLASGLLPELHLAVLPRSVEPIAGVIAEKSVAAPAYSQPESYSSALPDLGGQATAKPRVQSLAPKSHEVSANAALPSAPPLNWQGLLLLIWITGTVFFLARMAVTQLRLRRLIERALPVESISLGSRLRWLCRDMGIQSEVVLLGSRELDVPIAAGVFSPKIVLSPQSGEWSETRRNAVLCHELAHIKRMDGFTQLLANIASAIYWFNPLVWLTAREMRYERERACDDQVLSFGTSPSDYAHELLEIVSTLRRPQPAAALAMARRSQLEGRVLALLNPRVPHGVIPTRVALMLSVVVITFALPLAAAKLQERAAPAPVSAATTTTATIAGVAPVGTQSDDQDAVPAPASPAEPAVAPAAPRDPVSGAGATTSFEYHHNSDTKDSTWGSAGPFDCFTGTGVQHSNISSHSDDSGDRTFTATWSGSNCSVEAHSSGVVRFNAESTAIESISNGGYFEISERTGDNLRRLRLEPGANGQLN